jgi:3-hydroxybutyryl-CoA dehydratase
MKSFSEINIGDSAEFEVVIDEKMHKEFSNLSGDNSPIHCDDDFSKKTLFGKKIGYAFLLTSFLSRLYGHYLPGGSSVCFKQEASFIKPYYIGDTLNISGKVVDKIESTRFVIIESRVFRKDECLFKGTGTVQVLFDELGGE